MAHMAAIKLLMDQFKDDLFCLHFDTNHQIWIHSGKVTGKSFLIEIAYDVAISSSATVSRNPGHYLASGSTTMIDG